MNSLKEIARHTVMRMGYRITRLRPANRFEAMSETLTRIKGLGYDPNIVIDGGSNVGQWLKMARAIFPSATIHAIEPQPQCAKSLNELTSRMRNITFHPVALAEPGVAAVRMIGGGIQGGSTGAYVAKPEEEAKGNGEIMCLATTLDELFASCIRKQDRALLKLDLENYEMHALKGATRLLEVVEVVVTELQFFPINSNGQAVFADFLKFFDARGFELYDFASLSPRPRDQRLRQGDAIFIRRNSMLLADLAWQ